MSQKIEKELAIIGGGSVGPMLLVYLAQKALEEGTDFSGTRFNLINPKSFASGGIAYGDCHSAHKLNSTRDEMSPWDMNAFHEWCVEKGFGDNVQSFNARADYQKFLAEQTELAIDTLKAHGAAFKEHLAYANIFSSDDGYNIVDEEGSTLLSDIAAEDIVLSVGYGPNQNFENLRQHDGDGYIHSPYEHEQIRAIAANNPNPRIAFVGTGPALYDFTNAYDGNPENAELTVFSREGHLLDTRDVSVEPNEKSITPDYLVDENFVPQSLEELKEKIQADFDTAALSGERSPRRVALDILRHLKPLLHRIDLELAKEFRCSALHSHIKHTATPVPIDSQQRLQSFDPVTIKGRLNGNVERQQDGSFKIHLDGQEPVIVDYIINGTGQGRHNHVIFENLKRQNLAFVDERFDTLATDDSGYKLIGSGINCLGAATHFGCDGIESFAVNAEKLAIELSQRVGKRPENVEIQHIARFLPADVPAARLHA